MTVYSLPDQPAAAPEPYVFRPGEREALESIASAGERAGLWLRARAVEQGERPEWCHGRVNPLLDLAETVELVLTSLDPADSGHEVPDGRGWVEGEYGVPEDLLERLDPYGSVGLIGYTSFSGEDNWHGNQLPVEQIATVMVVVGCARMAVDTLRNDYGRDLPKLAATIDHALGATSSHACA
ncbi:hypothetical protein ACFQ7A_04830 [Streptomyces sp. NPDC056528]|uniref:hypothetical protein n=1 Tax=Streptomyces sp. NPDC056528 TaxID=3345854 RepID=UPI00367ECE56